MDDLEKYVNERINKDKEFTVSLLESGRGNPTIGFLVKLGKALNKKLELHYT